MCELDQLSEMGPKTGGVSRRQFGAIGAAGAMATLAACTTLEAESVGGLAERDVSFSAPGGTMDAFWVHPASGRHPGVILWPDIAGLRDSKKVMARRLAASGYSVIVPNPFYRSAPAPQFADFDDFRANNGFQKVGPWMQQNTPAAVMETARAIVAWLDAQAPVDSSRGIGNQGYCMTGSWTFYTGAAVPSRVKAAASFHGGGLAGEAPTAAINMFDEMAGDARALIAIAKNDDAQAPTDKDRLRAAAAAANLELEMEVYQGDHGWTVPDSPVYNQPEAERAWSRLLALYEGAL